MMYDSDCGLLSCYSQQLLYMAVETETEIKQGLEANHKYCDKNRENLSFCCS